MPVNISATFSKDQRPFNGLDAIAEDLADRTKLHETYVVVGVVAPKFVKLDAEDGTETPTVRFDHIEVLDGDDAAAAKALLSAAYKARTGRDDVEPASLFDVVPDGDEGDGPVSERQRDEWLQEG